MSNMSTGEFKRYVNELKFSKIIFNSDDQNRTAFPSVLFTLSFDSVTVSLKPDIIAFKSSSGILSFNNLFKIEHVSTSEIGSSIRITCKEQDKYYFYLLFFVL